MNKEKTKIYIIGIKVILCTAICLSIILLIAVAFFIVGIFYKELNIIGYIILGVFSVATLLILIAACFSPLYIELNNDSLFYKNLYGKVMLRHNWAELRSIEMRTIPSMYYAGLLSLEQFKEGIKQNYFLLNFSDERIEKINTKSIYKNKNAMILIYTKKNEELLRNFTDIKIEDNREIENTCWEFFRH